jgi:hypothetical protein
MKRRTCLATLASPAVVPILRAADPVHPIQVHVDMSVDPAKEREMLRHFEQDFEPAAAKFPDLITRGQQETAAIRTGDAVPIQLSEIHLIENNGSEPLGLMAVVVARDIPKELEFVDVNPGGQRRN